MDILPAPLVTLVTHDLLQPLLATAVTLLTYGSPVVTLLTHGYIASPCCYPINLCIYCETRAVIVSGYDKSLLSLAASTGWFSNSKCQKALCECDGAFSRCVRDHNSKFHNSYKDYDKSSC